jgi:glycosyltransferase involved in cell wall biosynthesis
MHFTFILTRSDQFSGPQIHIRDLSLHLLGGGHRVTVLVGGEGVFTDELAKLEINYHSLKHLVAPISPWRDLLAWCEIRARLRALDPDLVSTHSSKAGVIGRIAAASLGLTVLHTAHGWAFTRRVPAVLQALYLVMERVAARRGNHIITVSEYDREVAVTGGVDIPTRISTVHNGVTDVEPRLRADPRLQPPRIIMVARLERQKDHESLLSALAALRDLSWSLELVGDGPTRRHVSALVAELGLSDRVTMLGTRLDVAERLARAQLFTLVSHWEGFPRSILEAMRAGLPVIATDVAGVGEAVSHGGTGLLVERGDHRAVEAALRQLLSDPDLRVDMGRAARIRYEMRFTSRHLIDGTMSVYEHLLLGSSDPEVGTLR